MSGRDINPYDLNDVAEFRRRHPIRLKVTRPLTSDPYSAAIGDDRARKRRKNKGRMR